MDADHFTKYHLTQISAGLSILGSSILLAEVIADFQRGQRVPPVSRILASVSIGDILFSFAWFLGTWVAPSDLDYLDGTNHGSHQSCCFQGFILTVGGLTTIPLNAFLGVTYLLMVRHNWSESLRPGHCVEC